MNYQLVYPDGLDENDWVDIEAKGWLEGVRLMWDGDERELMVFDSARLSQAIADDMNHLGYFAAHQILIVPSVTRNQVEIAVSRMAERNFVDL